MRVSFLVVGRPARQSQLAYSDFITVKHGSIFALKLLLILFLSGCQTVGRSYPGSTPTASDNSGVAVTPIIVRDSGPATPLDVSHIPDAFPVIEPRTKAGNKSPYEVDGQTYFLIENIKGFEQVGDASWYGEKFHGQRTSNGEIYDMYGVTAAHKTLPIPCFVEVTNLANGKKVVVRVNDRGPFHSDRIIDLSYTAARKLGYERAGTARVKLKVLDPSPSAKYAGLGEFIPAKPGVAHKPRNSGGYEIPDGTFLQLGAFGDVNRANTFKLPMQNISAYPVIVEHAPKREVYRVLLGPLKDNWDLVQLQLSIAQQGYQSPKIVYRQP